MLIYIFTLIICDIMFNWVSKNTPKFLTLRDGFIAVSPTDIPFDLNFATWHGVPMTNSSVFLSFNISLFCDIQVYGRQNEFVERLARVFILCMRSLGQTRPSTTEHRIYGSENSNND